MALFKDTEDFKQHAPNISRHYSWANSLKRKVNHIATLRLWPYISQTEYQKLETAYLTNNPSAAQIALLEFLQPAEAYFTYLHLLSVDRISIAEMGVVENRSDDGTSSPASFNAIQDAKDEIAEMAYSFMDKALAYMEANKATFSDWAGSEAYTEMKDCFIWNTKQFNQYVKAGSSRHNFLSLKADRLGVQLDEIKPQLGEVFYDELLAAMKANTLTDNQQKAIMYIRIWLAKATMARALSTQRIKLVNGGIFLRSDLDGPARKQTADVHVIRDLRNTFESQAETAKTRLISFLDKNRADYPTYIPSTDLDKNDEPQFRRSVKGSSGYFRV